MRITAEAFSSAITAVVTHDDLVKLGFAGRIKGRQTQSIRVDMRPVLVGGSRMVQSVRTIGGEHRTQMVPLEESAGFVVELLNEGSANITVTTTSELIEYRVAKGGDVFVNRTQRESDPDLAHDRSKKRMLDPADPLLVAVGISTESGEIKAKWRDKYRQVDDFLRIFSTTLTKAVKAGQVDTPSVQAPLQVVDLGCGHAYLTFGAQAWLERVCGWPSRIVGVDIKTASMARNQQLAERLGVTNMTFIASGIAEYKFDGEIDVVLALHACDTATDDALAWAMRHKAKVIMSVPCCQHNLQTQMDAENIPAPLGLITRHGILRERFADLLTDAARAAILRQHGYRVDVIEFVSGEHTPRNLMIRAVKTEAKVDESIENDVELLRSEWKLSPALFRQLVEE